MKHRAGQEVETDAPDEGRLPENDERSVDCKDVRELSKSSEESGRKEEAVEGDGVLFEEPNSDKLSDFDDPIHGDHRIKRE